MVKAALDQLDAKLQKLMFVVQQQQDLMASQGINSITDLDHAVEKLRSKVNVRSKLSYNGILHDMFYLGAAKSLRGTGSSD